MNTPLPPTSDPGVDRPLPPPTPPGWRLVRARRNVFAGVCAGLAAATGVNVLLVRLAFVATGLSGIGILAYILLAIVLPREGPTPELALRPAPPETARWLRIALLVAPIVTLTGIVGAPWHGPFFGPLGHGGGFGLLLIAVAVFVIWLRRRRDDQPPAPIAPTSPATPPGSAWWQAPVPSAAAPVSETGDPFEAIAPDPVDPTPRAGKSASLVIARIFAWLAVIATVATAAAVIVLERVGALSIPRPVLLWGATALAVGAIIVAATWARTAMPVVASISLLLVPAVLGLVLASWDGGVGDRTQVPATLSPGTTEYRLAIGRLTLDLTHAELTGGTATIDATSRIGSLEVLVPADATVTVDAHVGAGQARVFGKAHSGLDVTDGLTDTPPAATTPGAGRRPLSTSTSTWPSGSSPCAGRRRPPRPRPRAARPSPPGWGANRHCAACGGVSLSLGQSLEHGPDQRLCAACGGVSLRCRSVNPSSTARISDSAPPAAASRCRSVNPSSTARISDSRASSAAGPGRSAARRARSTTQSPVQTSAMAPSGRRGRRRRPTPPAPPPSTSAEHDQAGHRGDSVGSSAAIRASPTLRNQPATVSPRARRRWRCRDSGPPRHPVGDLVEALGGRAQHGGRPEQAGGGRHRLGRRAHVAQEVVDRLPGPGQGGDGVVVRGRGARRE